MVLKDDWQTGEPYTAADANAVAAAVNAIALAPPALSSAAVSFSASVAMTGVTGTDRCYAARTLTEARMRVASAPAGSDLVVEVQSWDGTVWSTAATLTVDDGSVLEAVEPMALEQSTGDLLRLNVVSVGSSTAATGVVVDVLAG